MVNSIKHTTVFFLMISSFLHTLASADCFSQNVTRDGGQAYYLPEYNLWLPGSSSSVSILNLPSISDSIFTWQFVQVQPPWPGSDIFFIDSTHGWMSETYGGVFKTTDSGFNWEDIPIIPWGGAPFLGVHFIDRNTGWVVGSAHKIRKTTNGGFYWIKQDTFYYGIYYNNFNSVHFFNADTGIIIGERAHGYPDTSWGGCVLKTTNGGVNWNQVYSTNDTIYSHTELLRQFWLNKDTGWFTGLNILLKTTDGGVTFTNYYSHVPPTQNGANGFLDLYFIDENTGWLCGGNWDHKNIYKTTDAGLNWVFQDNPIAYYQFSQINGIIFINADTGWGSSFYGFIIVTTNGGNNWVIDYMGYETNKFASYKNSKVWLTADNGRIYYTYLNKPIGILNNNKNVPKDFLLEQNYPNPFNSSTVINYQLPIKAYVRLAIYNILGEEIEKLVDRQQNAGKYQVSWDGYDYPSGVYFYQLRTENYIETRKLVLLK